MNIYPHIPYVYLIGWSKLDRYYIGSKYAKGCHPKDLWVKYFTSSQYVKEFREQYGDPDIIQIRRTFLDSKKAREYEATILRRLDVAHDIRFLNKHPGDGNFLLMNHTKETCEKIRKSRLGQPSPRKGVTVSKETREKLRKARLGKPAWNKGIPHSDETKQKIRETQINKTIPQETRMKMREARNRVAKKTCPHCGMTGDPGNMTRHHFNNCSKVA